MNQVTLDPHGEMLMQQYRELLPTLEEVAKKAYENRTVAGWKTGTERFEV